MSSLKEVFEGLPLDPLPPRRLRDESIAHAPVRTPNLTSDEQALALENALRYFPQETHEALADEFADELRNYGHIYMYRFMPETRMRAYPVDEIPARNRHAAAIIHMILNNLDPCVAQFPQELVTYGGNGQVFSNWAQFLLTMKYLSEMTEDQTLVMYSGHPAGLFPSSPSAPRVVVTNGMVIPNYSSRDMYEKMFALGVSLYGQMTAGSYCYIGPQGIVHGTTLTVLNAARKHLGCTDMTGKVFVSSGLGGMSGAQPKAATICGCIGVVAEVSREALEKRYNQGWVMKVTDSLDECVSLIRQARKLRRKCSIGYHGNVVDLWERLVEEYDSTGDLLVDLGSDQTSCHNPFQGGYYPVQLSYEEARIEMHENPVRFKNLVQESLRRQVEAINKLTMRGMFFFDYGNAFLLEAGRAGADVGERSGVTGTTFRYPSYVQDIMGDIFSLGFGPFRWVCTSGDPGDLDTTDEIATSILEDIINKGVSLNTKQQYEDNIRWIKEANQNKLWNCLYLFEQLRSVAVKIRTNDLRGEYSTNSAKTAAINLIRFQEPSYNVAGREDLKMVVGSQARILYSDQKGRTEIATAFNAAVGSKKLKGPVVISRDHHDVSGTDSPYRETSNIYDGSAFCADMAVQNCIGDAFRGATWVALHNGGGVGWGEVMNGGFGLVLDGSTDARDRARRMLAWDVSNGVNRRCWAGNAKAEETICKTMEENPGLRVTVPYHVQDKDLLKRALKQ